MLTTPTGRGSRCPCTFERLSLRRRLSEEHEHARVFHHPFLCGCAAHPLCLPHVRRRAAGPTFLRNGLSVAGAGDQGGHRLLRRSRHRHGFVRADQRPSLADPCRSGRPVRAAPSTAPHDRCLRTAADGAGFRDLVARHLRHSPGRLGRARRSMHTAARPGDADIVARPGSRPAAAAARVQPGHGRRGTPVCHRTTAGGTAAAYRDTIGRSRSERRTRMDRLTRPDLISGGPRRGWS